MSRVSEFWAAASGVERRVGWQLRVLLGLVGVAAIAAGVLVATVELRGTNRGAAAAPSLAIAAFGVCIVGAGAVLVRGALRGRIAVRRTNFSRRAH